MLITTILLFLFLPLYIWSQDSIKGNVVVEEKLEVPKDTVYIYKPIVEEEITKTYNEILNKTNAQLSLWWNPYGVLIGSLGVLFTIMAIIFAIIIFRQSREYKEIIRKSIAEHGNVLDKMVAEREKQFKIMEANYDKTLAEYQKKLKTAKEGEKKDIEAFIQTIEKQKESFETQVKPKIVFPEYNNLSTLSSFGLYKPFHKCSSCGFGYQIGDSPLGLRGGLAYGLNRTITCPKCGNIEEYR